MHVTRVSCHETTFTMGRQTHGGPSVRLLPKLLSALLRHRGCTAELLCLCDCPCSAASTSGLFLPVEGLSMEAPAWPQASVHPLQYPAVPQELLGVHR